MIDEPLYHLKTRIDYIAAYLDPDDKYGLYGWLAGNSSDAAKKAFDAAIQRLMEAENAAHIANSHQALVTINDLNARIRAMGGHEAENTQLGQRVVDQAATIQKLREQVAFLENQIKVEALCLTAAYAERDELECQIVKHTDELIKGRTTLRMDYDDLHAQFLDLQAQLAAEREAAKDAARSIADLQQELDENQEEFRHVRFIAERIIRGDTLTDAMRAAWFEARHG